MISSAMTSFQVRYGPWAVVTGASDGIGKAMAREIARRGLNVVLVARSGGKLSALASELAALGRQTRVLSLDLGDVEASYQVARDTADLDVGLVVACAGFGTAGRFLDTDMDAELTMIDVNCRAVMALAKLFAPRLVARKRGGMVLLSSIVAFQGVPKAANYAATKAYVHTLAEGLRVELAPDGIDVIASVPGPVSSGFGARAGMRMNGAEAPETVARGTLDALGRKASIRPGVRAKILIGSLALLPRSARTFIMGRIMAGMTRHHAGKA
jgi:short-subunit dehydrogenase